MNQRCAVIATDAVGAAAGGLVRHERNGLVVPAGDPARPGAAIRRLHDDPALRARLGEAGSRGGRPRYTPQAWAAGFSEALEGAGNAGRAASVTVRPGRDLAFAPAPCDERCSPLLLLLLVPAGTARRPRPPADLLIDACRDEKVDGTYSQQHLPPTRSTSFPPTATSTRDCRDVINRARLAALNAR